MMDVWWESAARRLGDVMKLTSPVFAMILVIGNDVATGDELCQVNHAIESGVDHQAGNETVGGAVSEWDKHDGYEGWDGIANVSPIDGGNLSHHEAADLCCCQR